MSTEEIEKIKKLKVFQVMPTIKSKDVEWINWMKLLAKDFDRATAVSIFLKLWEKRGTSDARTLALRSFMKDKYKVDLGEGAMDKIVDLGGGVADTMSGLFKMGKISFYIGGGIILLVLGAVVYTVVKNPSAIMLATPAGRAASVAGGLKK